MEHSNEERFIFKVVNCKSSGEFGFKIVDLKTQIESEGIIHAKEDIRVVFREFSSKIKESGEDDDGKEITLAFVCLIENLYTSPIPDIKSKKGESVVDFLERKKRFLEVARHGLLLAHRLKTWFEEGGKPFIFIPEPFKESGDWIDVVIIPDNPTEIYRASNLLEPNKLYSKQQARNYIEDRHVEGWIDDFERERLLSEVNNLEDFLEQTTQEIEKDQAKHN